MLNTPYEIRDQASIDLIKAFESNFKKREINPKFTFDISFKSKKRLQSESIVLLKKYYKEGLFFPRSFGKKKLESFS